MFKYIVVHQHKYGHDSYQLVSPAELRLSCEDAYEALAELMGIDFEPNKGECIEIYSDDSEPLVISIDDVNIINSLKDS